jgi:hypothetical protein
MPNGHSKKEYGVHEYDDTGGTSDCRFNCGCWAGPARSGGPIGLDPFGACPGNPVDGKLLGGKNDYENVVIYRIRDLESRLYKAEELLKRTSPSKAKLAAELAAVEAKLAAVRREFAETKAIAERVCRVLGESSFSPSE